MRSAVLLFAAVLLAPAFADTSPRRDTVNPGEFTMIRSFVAPRVSILSPAGQYLLSYGGTGGVLFDLERRKKIADLEGHTGGIHDGYFSGDGSVIVTLGYEGTVRVWESRSGEELCCAAAGHAGYA